MYMMMTVSVPDQDVEKECVPRGKPVSSNIGFITSPNYPAESRFKTCRWKIRVPPGHFAHIFLHEVHIFVYPFVLLLPYKVRWYNPSLLKSFG